MSELVLWDDACQWALITRQEHSMAIEYAPGASRSLSVNAPYEDGRRHEKGVEEWCSNALPENGQLRMFARHANAREHEIFRILAGNPDREYYGKLRLRKGTWVGEYEPLGELTGDWIDLLFAEQAQKLRGYAPRVRASLSGMMNKTALLRDGHGSWWSPLRDSASTHVLKIPDRLSTRQDAALEWTGQRMAERVGVEAARCEILLVSSRKGPSEIVVSERFDRGETRATDPGRFAVARYHQEDLLAATGRWPTDKYSWEVMRGALQYRELGAILRRFARCPEEEGAKALRAVVLHACIANFDAHGKNWALVHECTGHGGTRVALAPAYDISPMAARDEYNTEFAINVGGKRRPRDLQEVGWRFLSRDLGVEEQRGLEIVRDTIEKVHDEIVAGARECIGSQPLRDPRQAGEVLDDLATETRQRCAGMLQAAFGKGIA